MQFVENFQEGLGIPHYDFPKLPGAAKAINDCVNIDSDLAIQCVNVPCYLHHAKRIIIVNHQDCGAYGGSQKFNGDEAVEQKFHEEELKKAKAKLSVKYPDKEIVLVYARLVDNQENIEFMIVK